MSDEQEQFSVKQKIPDYRKVAPNNGITWLAQAFYLFKQNPLAWFSSIILMFLVLFVIMLLPIVNIFSIALTPVFTAGLMLACNNLKTNKPFKIGQLFSGFSQNFNALLIVGLIYLGYTLISSLIAVELAEFFDKPLMQVTPEMLTTGTLDIQAFLESLLLPMLILMALMLPIFMAIWFAPALVILRDVKAIQAMRHSYLACLANLKAFTIYGLVAFIAMLLLIILVTLLSALIPGLSILMKLLSNLFFMGILIASMFTSFEDIFYQEAPADNDNDKGDSDNFLDNDDGPGSLIL